MFTHGGYVITEPSFAEPLRGRIITRGGVGSTPGGCMTDPNPMQSLLRRHLGMDAFALDGDETEVQDRWSDKPRKTKLAIDGLRVR